MPAQVPVQAPAQLEVPLHQMKLNQQLLPVRSLT